MLYPKKHRHHFSCYLMPRNIIVSVLLPNIPIYMSYCNVAWASTCHTRLTILTTLQTRAIRIVCNVPFRAHTKPLFKDLNILPFDCINKLQIGIFMYKLNSNLMVASFGHWFCKNLEVHDHYTRSANKYHQESVRTTTRQHTIRIKGPLFWNSLPTDLTSVSTMYQFKCKLPTRH